METTQKHCSLCNILKDLEEFNKTSQSTEDLPKHKPYCKICERLKSKQHYANHKARYKKKFKEYYRANKDTLLNVSKAYYHKNKESLKIYNKLYQKENAKILQEKIKIRKQSDHLFRYKLQQYTLFKTIIKTIDSPHTKSLLLPYIGCTKEELKQHLNSGKYTLQDYTTNTKNKTKFHIDHIIPTSYFLDRIELDENNKPTKETELFMYKWWNYRNLRIVSVTENTEKKNSFDTDLIKLHKIEDLL